MAFVISSKDDSGGLDTTVALCYTAYIRNDVVQKGKHSGNLNLSSDQAARINYDSANSNYFDDQIAQYVAAGGELAQIDRNTFDVWFDVDQENVDDTEEAEAHAWSTFQERLAAAKASAFVEMLESSDYGIEAE